VVVDVLEHLEAHLGNRATAGRRGAAGRAPHLAAAGRGEQRDRGGARDWRPAAALPRTSAFSLLMSTTWPATRPSAPTALPSSQITCAAEPAGRALGGGGPAGRALGQAALEGSGRAACRRRRCRA
jgi:hypothetical protein